MSLAQHLAQLLGFVIASLWVGFGLWGWSRLMDRTGMYGWWGELARLELCILGGIFAFIWSL